MPSVPKKPKINRGSGDRSAHGGFKDRGKGKTVCSAAFSSPPNFSKGGKGSNSGHKY